MGSFQYLADGHHVDDAGNLIACTYVDFRDPAERFPITALHKASSKHHAIPGCETTCWPGSGAGKSKGRAERPLASPMWHIWSAGYWLQPPGA